MGEKKKTNILDLNDGCLTKIFSYLDNYHELFKVHFKFCKAIGNAIIENKQYHFEFDRENIDEMEKEYEEFLNIFGGKIKNILIYNDTSSQMQKVSRLISSYCAGSNIKNCTFMSGSTITNEFVEQIAVFLNSLVNLWLFEVNVNPSTFRKLIENIRQIKTLHIDNVNIGNNVSYLLSTIQIYGVTTFSLRSPDEITECEINRLPANTTVTELDLKVHPLNVSILNHFKNLTELYLEILKLPEPQLALMLNGLAERNVETLQEFKLFANDTHFDVCEVTTILCKMKNLHSLHLDTCPNFEYHRLDFAIKLINLRDFHIEGRADESLLDEEFERLLYGFVSLAINLKRLKIVAPDEADGLFFQQVYEQLVRIRSIQRRDDVLHVFLRHETEEMFIDRNEGITLSVCPQCK